MSIYTFHKKPLVPCERKYIPLPFKPRSCSIAKTLALFGFLNGEKRLEHDENTGKNKLMKVISVWLANKYRFLSLTEKKLREVVKTALREELSEFDIKLHIKHKFFNGKRWVHLGSDLYLVNVKVMREGVILSFYLIRGLGRSTPSDLIGEVMRIIFKDQANVDFKGCTNCPIQRNCMKKVSQV